MARRSAERDTARAEYIERRSRGEEVNLAELADRLGVKRQTLRNWKSKYKWDEAVPPPPKKKRGGQPGNKNSKGKKNAAGSHSGAPTGNKNAEKDGAYSAVFLDMLTDHEREIVEKTPLEVRAALEHEMKILKFREHKILEKIAEYEKAEEGAVYLSAMTEIRGKNNTTMRFSDSAFKRVQSLQEALYKVQGRISKIADSLRGLDESAARLAMERERLDILRMRASGSVDVPGMEESDDPPDKVLEDEQ